VIDAMPRPRPTHLVAEKTRHGRIVWYCRIGQGPRTRIKSKYGTPEFAAAFEAALRGEQPTAPAAARSGSLAWLIARYREVDAWRSLSPATRRQRENIFKYVIRSAGKTPYGEITRATIVAGRDRRAGTPDQARHFLDAMRGLFKWALEAELVKADPTAGIKNPKRPKNEGFPVWSERDVERYCERWPLGTKERVWLDVLLYTGLRRGDAVKLGRQHVRDGIATLRTEKSQGAITVSIPILPVLASTLAAGPCGELTYIVGESRQPLTKESFGNMFRDACRAAGVNKSAHGVRKIGATRAANNGATVAELEAIFGWVGGAMASLYTRAADRARLAKRAIGKLENIPGNSIPAPWGKVRDSEPNE
jgi:integrase